MRVLVVPSTVRFELVFFLVFGNTPALVGLLNVLCGTFSNTLNGAGNGLEGGSLIGASGALRNLFLAGARRDFLGFHPFKSRLFAVSTGPTRSCGWPGAASKDAALGARAGISFATRTAQRVSSLLSD